MPVEVAVVPAVAGDTAIAEAEIVEVTSGEGNNDGNNESAATLPVIVGPSMAVPAGGSALKGPVLTASALPSDENLTSHLCSASMPPALTPRSAGGVGAGDAAPVLVVSPSGPPRAVCGAAAAAAASMDFDSGSSTRAELGLARKSTASTVVSAAAATPAASSVAAVAVEVVGSGRKNATDAVAILNNTGTAQQMAVNSGSSKYGVAVVAQTRKKGGESGRQVKPSSAASPSIAFGGGRPRATAAMAVATARAKSPRVVAKAAVTSANPASASKAISGYRAPTKSSKARVGGGRGGRENDAGSPRAASLRVGSPRAGSPRVGSPRVGSPRVGSPRVGSPRVGSPRIGSPRAGSPRAESPRAGSPRALPGFSASSPAAVAAPSQQRVHQRKTQQKQSPRGTENCKRGRDRARVAGDKDGSGSRKGRRVSSSAPPPELREEGCASGVKVVGTDIVTSSDLVTSAQVRVSFHRVAINPWTTNSLF